MTTLTGILRDSGGNPITGKLWLELSQAGTYNPGGILVTPLQPTVFTLTAGQITGPGPGPYSIYGNDGITPSVTFYALTAFDAAGSQVLRLNVRFTGASADLGALTIAPTQTWTIPPGYVLTLTGDVIGTSAVTQFNPSVVTPFSRTYLDDANADAVRATIGAVGTGGITGSAIPKADTGNCLVDSSLTESITGSLDVDLRLTGGRAAFFSSRAAGAGDATVDALAGGSGNGYTGASGALSAMRLSSMVAGASKLRWELRKADVSTELGSNVGSNLSLRRHADDGSYLDEILEVDRGTGRVTVRKDVYGEALVQGYLRDRGGQVWNAKAYGVVGDGTTDDTSAITAFIATATASSTKAILYFPPGTYNIEGDYDLTGKDGLEIIGAGQGATTFRITHASNDLFYITTTETKHLKLRGFTVTSDTVTRTGGWVFRVNTPYNGGGMLKNAIFEDIQVLKQVNGIAWERFQWSYMGRVFIMDPVGTTGIGLKVGQTTSTDINQGVEGYFEDIQVYGNSWAGWTTLPLGFAVGIQIEDCDATYWNRVGTCGIHGDGLKMIANSSGHNTHFHFFEHGIFDGTNVGHSAHITGTGQHFVPRFTGCWFASAGTNLSGDGSATACGLVIDNTNSVTGGSLTGCYFGNHKGNALRVTATGHQTIDVSGSTFEGNGFGGSAGYRSSIYINTGSSLVGPSITGCLEGGSNLYSIETTATSAGVYVAGNHFQTATSYGVLPKGIYSGTYTPTLTGVANVSSTSDPHGTFSRVDNVVHVAVVFAVTATSASTMTKIEVSLPITSNLAGVGDLAGTGTRDTGTAMQVCRIVPSGANDRAEVRFYTDASTAAAYLFCHFSYRVL